MKNGNSESGGCLIVTLGGLSLAAAMTVISGLVIKVLWAWFVVDQFDAPSLSVAGAVGLSLLATAVHPQGRIDKDRSLLELAIEGLVLRPGILLAVGWIAHSFL